MKSFPRWRGEEGWEAFGRDSPADCLSYARFRQSREAIDVEDRIAELERALQVVETESGRARVELELERARKKAAGEVEGEEDPAASRPGVTVVRLQYAAMQVVETESGRARVELELERARKKAAGEVEGEEEDPAASRPSVTVVRLQYGEVAEATTVFMLPVLRETDGVAAMESTPRRTKTDVDLGIVEVDKAWARWAGVPGWGPVAEAADDAVRHRAGRRPEAAVADGR